MTKAHIPHRQMHLTHKLAFCEASERAHLDKIKNLIDILGIDHCRGWLAQTPLFNSVFEHHLPITKYLTKVCGSHVTSKRLKELLRTACRKNYLDTIKYLVEHCGADPCFDNNEPLCIAVYHGDLKSVEYLVSKGAVARCPTETGHLIDDTLCRAVYNGKPQITEYLIDQKVTSFPAVHPRLLDLCARAGHLGLVKRIVKECGVDLRQDDGTLESVLCQAAVGGCLDVVVWLVKNGSPSISLAHTRAMYTGSMNVFFYLTAHLGLSLWNPLGSFPQYTALTMVLVGFFYRVLGVEGMGVTEDDLFEENLGMVVGLYL